MGFNLPGGQAYLVTMGTGNKFTFYGTYDRDSIVGTKFLQFQKSTKF